MNSTLLTHVDVPLTVPVPVKGEDGRMAERSKLVLKRPKVRHTKMLAALVGSDIIDTLINSDAAQGDKGADRQLVIDILQKLLSPERLEGVTRLIADLAGEDVSVIDEVDAIDLPAIFMAFGGFFPKLQSAAAGILARTSRSSGDTTPAP